MMSRSVRIAKVVFGVGLAVSLFANIWAFMSIANLKEGGREGFYLPGTYQIEDDASATIAFAADSQDMREGVWQWRPNHTEWLAGSYVSSEDPNYFLLVDSDGSEVGYVDLRYGSKTDDGFLYLSIEDKVLPMIKTGDPVFIESGDS